MSRESQQNTLLKYHCCGPYGAIQLEKIAKKQHFGPFSLKIRSFWGLFGTTGIPISSTKCIWVVRIHITPLGPLTDLYCTPGPPKGPVLAPKGPFGGPTGLRKAPADQIWSQLPQIGLTGLESWLPHTLTWYPASSGPPRSPKGPVLAPKDPFGGPRGPRRAPRDQFLSQLLRFGLTGLESRLPHTMT